VCDIIYLPTNQSCDYFTINCDFNFSEACAQACLEQLRSATNAICTGWQPGPFGGFVYNYEDGVSLNGAVTALQAAGFCDVIPYSGEVVQLRPPSEEEPDGYWDVVPPHITARCCNDSYNGPADGAYVVTSECATPYGEQNAPVLCSPFSNPNQFPLCQLKPGAINIAPWGPINGIVFACSGNTITRSVCEFDPNIISSLPEECIKGPCVDGQCVEACYGPCESGGPPCEIPEFMYVDWGINNLESGPIAIPTRNQGAFGDFFGTVCAQGDLFCSGQNPFDPGDDAPEGTESSVSIANVGPVVWCDGVAYVTATIRYFCFVCRKPPGSEFVSSRALFGRTRTVCLRWENDEDGCPVGDAQVVQWSGFSPYFPVEPGGGFDINVDGPRPEACGDLPGDGCACSSGCDGQLDPVISFLPP
jgi:hypothetical protein